MLIATGCSLVGGDSTERVVQVDYRNDEFPSHYWRYFPGTVEAHPGDTIAFRQQWTGEPHTITLGRLVDRAVPRVNALQKKYGAAFEERAAQLPAAERDALFARADAEFEKAMKDTPTFFPYDAAAQNVEQPCYLATGLPPTDKDTPCPKSRQHQPEFDGRQVFYSSGFIPPEGANGNTYRVKLADQIDEGAYHFYCTIHFPWMQGKIVVKPKGERVDSAAEVARRARTEIRTLARPLERSYAAAQRGDLRYQESVLKPPVGGYHSGDEFTVAIDAFVPKSITTRVGRRVTWSIVGPHTVSFGVPRYLPIYVVQPDGTVERNTRVDRPAGGSPKVPAVDFESGPIKIDGGIYDGNGFFSSGLLGSEPFSKYTLRFSKPGRYKYACLVHPLMVGTIIVRR